MEDAKIIFKINPTAKFVKLMLVIAVLVSLLGFLNIYLALLGLPFLFIAVSNAIIRKFVVFSLTDDFISSERGIINKTTVSIPLSKIQNARLTKNLFQRMFGVGDILVETAGESESTHKEENEIIILNIDNPDYYYKTIMKQIGR